MTGSKYQEKGDASLGQLLPSCMACLRKQKLNMGNGQIQSKRLVQPTTDALTKTSLLSHPFFCVFLVRLFVFRCETWTHHHSHRTMTGAFTQRQTAFMSLQHLAANAKQWYTRRTTVYSWERFLPESRAVLVQKFSCSALYVYTKGKRLPTVRIVWVCWLMPKGTAFWIITWRQSFIEKERTLFGIW